MIPPPGPVRIVEGDKVGLLGAGDYRVVFEASPDAMLVVDADGVIRDLNPQALSLFGWSPRRDGRLHGGAADSGPGAAGQLRPHEHRVERLDPRFSVADATRQYQSLDLRPGGQTTRSRPPPPLLPRRAPR